MKKMSFGKKDILPNNKFKGNEGKNEDFSYEA